MSISLNSGHDKNKRELNADLNLVPYIDLLTCMVAFLLITAVWSHLASLSVNQKTEGRGEEASTPPLTKLVVVVSKEGFNLVAGRDQQPLALAEGRYDYGRLTDELKKAKLTQPDRTDIQIASEDGISFETVVHTMDTAIAGGFPAVSLVESSAAGI